jgi:tetratricopeptide (TPR) repeat protein
LKTTSRTRSTAAKPAKKAAPLKKKAPAARTATLDKAIKDYEEALKVMGRKDYTRAGHLFESIIKEYPTEREVCDRSRIYLSVCRSHAPAASQKARGPEDPYYLGVIAANDGRLDEAAELFEKVLRQNAQSNRAHYALASVCGMKGDAAGAIDHLRKAIELSPANRVQALNDSDFDSLRDNAEFMALLGKTPEGGL